MELRQQQFENDRQEEEAAGLGGDGEFSEAHESTMKAYRRAGKMQCSKMVCRSEESGRFLKKAAQKLLLCWAIGVVGDKAHGPA